MHEYLTEKEVSERLRIPVETLRHWRKKRQADNQIGPPYSKFGRAVRYNRHELSDYETKATA